MLRSTMLVMSRGSPPASMRLPIIQRQVHMHCACLVRGPAWQSSERILDWRTFLIRLPAHSHSPIASSSCAA